MSSTNMTKYILAFIGAVVIAGAIYGAYQYPKAVISLGSTTLGGTTSTAHFYSVAANLATVGANATTSSVYNSSANDYYITSAKVGCEGIGSSKTVNTGAGLSALTLTIAISSTAAPVAFNPLAGSTFNGGAITIPTTTTQFASSTPVLSGTLAYVIWPSLTYITFAFNATNTAACTIGVEAFSS